MNLLKKGVALAMAVVTAGALGACSIGSDTNWVAKYDQVTVPAGVYIASVLNSYFDVTAKVPEDSKNPLKEQVDGTLASDLVKTKAKESFDQYIAVEKKFDEMGLTLTEADMNEITQNAEIYWSYFGLGATFEKNGVSKDSYLKTSVNSSKKAKIFEKIYGAGGEEEVTLDTLRPDFQSNYAKVIMIPLRFNKDDEGKIANEQLTRDTIQKYLDRAKVGENMEDLQFEARKEGSDDPDSLVKPAAGESYDLVDKNNSQYADEVTKAIFDAKLGEPTVAETADGMYLFTRYELNDADLESRRISLVSTLKADEFNEKVKGWAQGLEGVTYNDKALSRYTPEKLKV